MKHHTTRRYAACLTAAVAMVTSITTPATELTNPRCEYLSNPLGIDAGKPRLSWKIAGSKSNATSPQAEIPRGLRQTAYQILVASTPDLLAKNQGDLWDSGKVTSDTTSQIEYGGKPLQSRQRCFWKVKAWLTHDGDSSVSVGAESKPAVWEMGLLNNDDWQAKWIEGAGYVEKKPQAAPDPSPFSRRFTARMARRRM